MFLFQSDQISMEIEFYSNGFKQIPLYYSIYRKKICRGSIINNKCFGNVRV